MSHSESSKNGDSARRTKGEKSRATILLAAAQLATTRGLKGLSLGDLAAHLGMSKSGLYAHFKSKDELELATIETAVQIFDREVLQPVRSAPAGKRRLLALVESFLSHLERQIFPGGCFFAAAAAELDTYPGRAHDRVMEVVGQWSALIRQCLDEARAQRELVGNVDLDQAVFEVQAMLTAANFQFVLTSNPLPLQQARKGISNVLDRLPAKAAAKKNVGRR